MIYEDTFETAQEALDALRSFIEERDGKYIVGGELRRAFDNAGANASESKKYRQRAQNAEASARELQEKLASKEAELDELLKLNPQETQKQLQEYAREKAALATQLKAAQGQLEPLQSEIAKYKAAEKDAQIVAALRAEASKIGIRPEALRDVERLKSSFNIDELSGVITDADGRDVATALSAELKASPHWLPVSQGGGSSGGGGTPKTDNERRNEAFDQAAKAGDYFAMINATL